MKRTLILTLGLAALALCGAQGVRAQTAASKPDPAVLRDPLLEQDSKKNLEAARHYFKLRKAYVASLSRAEEIIAGYPNFSQIDEALYIAGMSNLRLARGEGKQKAKLTAEKHREEARLYLSRLVNEYPESKFRKDAEKELRSIGGETTKSDKQ